MNIAICWLGNNDIKEIKNENGPVFLFCSSHFPCKMDSIYILSNQSSSDNQDFIKNLKCDNASIIPIDFENPTDYNSIYKAVCSSIDKINDESNENIQWYFFISSGTSQMTTIWVLLSQTSYNGTLIQSEFVNGKYILNIPHIPFNIKTEYISNQLKEYPLHKLEQYQELPVFNKIIHSSDVMKDLLYDTYLAALYDIPVLILGESGTGKELLANAIHQNSSRKRSRFTTINCSTLPESLVDSMLFGYSKGAFTGALSDTPGIFEQNNKGTLFLDEIGDLPLQTQVKILRVIENGSFQRVGDMKTLHTNVRIIAATNRDIYKMIKNNLFREDLFYRISSAILHLPPLRHRGNDIIEITEQILKTINTELSITPGYTVKTISSSGYDFIKQLKWPGNIRELYHTIKRCCIFIQNETIEQSDIMKYATVRSNKQNKAPPSDLENYLNKIRIKYIKKALVQSNNNKTSAAKILGYKNYQNIDYILSNTRKS